MEIFKKGEFEVRTERSKDGEVLFKAKDVAKSLGYKRPENATSKHVSGKYKVRIAYPSSGGMPTIFLKEPGFYELIFGSELPTAKRFRDWVFEEVLPSIRKTGKYEMKSYMQKLEDIEQNLTRKCENLRECKNIVININNNLKDPLKVEMGHKGGKATAKKHRDTENKLLDLQRKIDEFIQIVNN